MNRRNFITLFSGAVVAWPVPTLAQIYPTRPVRIIVPFAPAGPTDVFARLLVQKLSQNLGPQFYVENQVGAGGNIGPSGSAMTFTISLCRRSMTAFGVPAGSR